MTGKYVATGLEAEFEPGSRGRVLRNLLGITRVRDMNEAESQALLLAQDAALDLCGPDQQFTAADVRALHRLWLGPIYPGRASTAPSTSARPGSSLRMRH